MSSTRRLLVVLLGTAAAMGPVAALGGESPVPVPPSPVARLLAARSQADRAKEIDALVASGATVDSLAPALETGRTYASDVPRGWIEKTIVAPDAKERPYLLHVPKDYDPARRYRMVIDLHGGVSGPAPPTHAELAEMKPAWGGAAEQNGWILAFPAGEKGAVWWDAVGSGMVLDILRATKRTYNVDEDAVFATGFSDGGSGSWFLANSLATPFAGFVPLSGHPSVAGAGGTQIHLRNLVNKPVYALNTDLDPLYPAAGVKPIADAAQALGAPLVWREVRGYRHEMTYVEKERDKILVWMVGVRRDPHPRTLWWEGAAGDPSRVHWLRVTNVTGGSGGPEFPDANPVLTDSRVRLGVAIDQEFRSPGARIQSVVDGSIAREMGLAEGDVIVAIDGADVAGAQQLRALLGKKAPGEEIAVRAKRGDASIEKTAKIPPAKREPAFSRDKPWGSIRAEVQGNRVDVRCAGIGAFEILLADLLLDLARPVEIVVNGKSVSSAVATPDLRFTLEQWAEDEDRSLVYKARVAVQVPGAAK